jgi:hypothetical protein
MNGLQKPCSQIQTHAMQTDWGKRAGAKNVAAATIQGDAALVTREASIIEASRFTNQRIHSYV